MTTPGMTPKTRDQWDKIHYPELSDSENEEIRVARRLGYAAMFPAFPSAETQANTLGGGSEFNEQNGRQVIPTQNFTTPP